VKYDLQSYLFLSSEIWGAFYSTKNSEQFQKIWKFFNRRKANHANENSVRKIKCYGNSRKEISENLGIPREVGSLLEIPKIAVALVTGKFPKIQTRSFHRMESAPGISWSGR